MPQDFHASATLDFSDPGAVRPAGNSGRFLVDDRCVTGDIEGDIDGTFSMVFDANLSADSQSGPLKGIIEFYDDDGNLTYTAKVNAMSQGVVQSFEAGIGGVMELEIDGRLTFFDQAQGQADFKGVFEVHVDESGQIDAIIDSAASIDGFWI